MKRLLPLILCLFTCPLLVHAGAPKFEIATIQDSVPNTKFYLNTYGVLAPLADGRIFVTWTAAARWPDNYPPFHSGTKGIIYGAFSSDNGKTWSPPQEMINSPNNDLDPHVVVDGKTIIVMSTTVPRPFSEWWADTWMTRSNDNGKTWTKQVVLPRWRTYLAGRRHIGVRLNDGTLVLPAAWESSVEGRVAKRDEAKRTWDAGVLVSTDSGKTWAIRGQVSNCDGGMCDEAAIVKLKNGDLYMLIRTEGEWLMETRSDDKGRTWTAPARTSLQAHNSPPALWRLRNGAIVVVWNNSREKRYPLAAAYSTDEGVSWSKPKVIADIDKDAKEGFEISYPSVVEARDGTILVTYQRALGRLQGRDLKLARFNFAWLQGE